MNLVQQTAEQRLPWPDRWIVAAHDRVEEARANGNPDALRCALEAEEELITALRKDGQIQ